MKRNLIILTLLLVFSVAGILTSQVVIQRRVMDSFGMPAGQGYGTALPTVANDGRNPVDGELFVVRTDGADPVLRFYNEFETSWNTVSNVSVGNDFVIFRDDFCGISVQQNDGTLELVADTNLNHIRTTAGGVYLQRIEIANSVGLALPLTTGECGLDVSGDVTADDGHAIRFGEFIDGSSVHIIQAADTSATFYFEISITIGNISGFDGDWAVGLLVPEAFQDPPQHDGLNTYFLATLSDNAGDLDFEADVDAGGQVNDDAGIAWADGETRVLRFEINTDGYAAYVDGLAITLTNVNATGANDFTDLDKLLGFYYHTQGAEGAATGVVLNYIEWGYGQL